MAAAFGLLAACGNSSSKPGLVAVGTYLGGGSYLTGPSTCTYTGAPGVFGEDGGKKSTDAESGPRFIVGPGQITEQCKSGVKNEYKAVVPTGTAISGPASIKADGKESAHFEGYLVAGGQRLGGEPGLGWELGPDCSGIAEFGPVHGAQDTGGKDRDRSLVATAKGTCTIKLTASTGSDVLYPSFKGATFHAEQKVTIQ